MRVDYSGTPHDRPPFERPQSWVAFMEGFHCILIMEIIYLPGTWSSWGWDERGKDGSFNTQLGHFIIGMLHTTEKPHNIMMDVFLTMEWS